MKTTTFLFLFIGILSCAFSAFAWVNTNAVDCDYKIENANIAQQARVYVQPEQIHINTEGMFVEIDGNLYQVAQFCEDEKGFYVRHAEFWVCCVNGHPNPPWRLTCQVCGVPL